MKAYNSGQMKIWYKIIRGKGHPTFIDTKNEIYNLGVAFRSQDSPIGYMPFYGVNDFDLSGNTTLKEELWARLPIDMSSVASPHTLLLKEVAGDVDFMGSGDPDLNDIQSLVKLDLVRHSMTVASGVFVDSLMMALGGPVIKGLVKPLIKSTIQSFIVSKSISAVTKKYIKDQASVNVDRFLRNAP